mmetsp:Transcript_81016/g.217390  ORF Transcript_81016/g.217390 Transcript_81016/m.217390 type:complete len:215 (+) Transcript_81016:254-898(+)
MVLEIDNLPANSENIANLLRGRDEIGSIVDILVEKKGKYHDSKYVKFCFRRADMRGVLKIKDVCFVLEDLKVKSKKLGLEQMSDIVGALESKLSDYSEWALKTEERLQTYIFELEHLTIFEHRIRIEHQQQKLKMEGRIVSLENQLQDQSRLISDLTQKLSILEQLQEECKLQLKKTLNAESANAELSLKVYNRLLITILRFKSMKCRCQNLRL